MYEIIKTVKYCRLESILDTDGS